VADVASQQNAERYVWGGDCDGWHLLKSPELSVIQERVPPGRREVRHYHQQAHQFFFVLSGRAALEVDGRSLTLTAQQGCSVPARAPHQLINEDAGDLVFLVISAPPSHGDRIDLEKA
jgi:mannose-6-phosphate isomerase-like protein (cupin superfamily)